MADELKDIKDQFKEMHKDLDKLVEAQKPIPRWRRPTETEQLLASKDQTKAIKAQTKQAKEQHAQTKSKNQQQSRGAAPGPQVELGKETRKDILSALRNIRSQIVVSQQRENTAADVAAEHLAGGGSLLGAAGAGIGFKGKKLKGAFKRKFDPLNIVNRLTGSKLATVLAGKLTGRSEKSIRAAAGLAGGLQTEVPQFGSPSPYAQGSESPSAMDSGRAITLLEKMAGSLTRIEATQSEIALQGKRQETQLDELKDAAAEEKGEFHKTGVPTQVTKTGAAVTKEGEGLMGMLMKGLFSPLGVAIAGLIAAGALLYKQWQNLKLSFSLLGDSISDLWESIKAGFVSMKNWVGDALNSVSDSIVDAGESLLEGVKGFIPGYKGPTETEKIAKLKESAAAGSGYAQRKLDKLSAEKVPAPGESAAAIAKSVSTYAMKVPADAKKSAAEALQRGDYDAAATGSLLGTTPVQGTPEQKAVTGAVTQLVAKSYGEVFKDAQGKPLTPMTDKEHAARRVPAMVKEATQALSKSLTSGAPTPATVENNTVSAQTITAASTAPTELQAPVPMTGQALNDSAEMLRAASMAPAENTGGRAIVNVRNNKTSQTTIHQNMAPARSGESSYLRSLDRHFAPA